MRVLVCGGRTYADKEALFRVLDDLHAHRGPITLIMHGCATGADQLGEEWAKANQVPVQRYPAEWRTWGAGAGPRRNQHMLDTGRPDVVVPCPGGKGTADMRRRTEKAGVEIVEVPAGAKETA